MRIQSAASRGGRTLTTRGSTRRAQVRILTEITGTLLKQTGPDPAEVMKAAVTAMAASLGDSCVVSIIDRTGQLLVPVAYEHRNQQTRQALEGMFDNPLPVGRGFAGQVAASGQPLLLNDIPQEQLLDTLEPAHRRFTERWGLRSLLIVPLQSRGKVIGTLALARQEKTNYTEADLDLASEVASRVSIAFNQANLYKKLVETERMFRSTFYGGPVGMALLGIAKGNDGEFMDVNGRFCELVMTERDALVGKNESDLTHPDDRPINADWLGQIEKGDAANLRIEKRYLRGDGQTRWVRVSAAPVRTEDGHSTLVLLHVEDITAARTAEMVRSAELARSTADLANWANLASHDLQAPLRTISGYTQILAASMGARELTAEQQQLLNAIVEGVAEMTHLIRDLLQYARLEAEYATAKQTEVSLQEVHGEVVNVLAAAIADSGAEVTWVGDDETVVCSGRMLRHVFFNLIHNAITYRSPDRPPVVTTTARRLSDGFVEIAIADNGIGIPPEQQVQVFELFRKLSKGPGTGMGLPLVRRMLEFHGGSIDIVSAGTDKGTTVLVRLPREPLAL